MARTIGLHPETQYEFQTLSHYRGLWLFLPDKERVEIIASQLSYLDFHGWLKDNLKHCLAERPTDRDWSDVVWDPDEGFHRTDILLYAAICEAALHAVFYLDYKSSPTGAHDALKRCYEKTEESFIKLNNAEFEMPGALVPTKGILCLRSTTTSPIAETDVKLHNLIRTGKELNAYDDALAEKLHDLRANRNTIHLAAHIRVREKDGKFTREDRVKAANTTEELRQALKRYVEQQCPF